MTTPYAQTLLKMYNTSAMLCATSPCCVLHWYKDETVALIERLLRGSVPFVSCRGSDGDCKLLHAIFAPFKTLC